MDRERARYPHPFTGHSWGGWYGMDTGDYGNKDSPRTLAELRMCELSATIREKKDWHIKFRDPEIQDKWRSEVEEQQEDEEDDWED